MHRCMMRARIAVAVTAAATAVACGSGDTRRVDGPAGMLAVNDGGGPPGRLPVVFVHSLAGNTAQWRAQLEHLRPERRAVALDLRGHGRSAAPADELYTLDAMADDVAAVVDALGIDRFVLVGHSMGGDVAMTYAARHPDRVAGLLLADANGDPSQIPASAWDVLLAHLASDAYGQTIGGHWSHINQQSRPDVRERVFRDLRATPKAAVVGAFRSMRRFDPRAALEAYGGPVAGVVSDLNNTPASLHNVIPELDTAQIHDTGHWVQMDKPEEFNRLLDAFVEGVEAGEPRRARR